MGVCVDKAYHHVFPVVLVIAQWNKAVFDISVNIPSVTCVAAGPRQCFTRDGIVFVNGVGTSAKRACCYVEALA